MEYRLQQHNTTGEVYAVREDGLAGGPLRDNDYRDNDASNATIRVEWAGDQQYTEHRAEIWNSDDYTVLATDKDTLNAVVDQPQSLERGVGNAERGT